MAKASDNQFPSVLIGEGSAPASPGAGTQRVFIDTADHKLKRKDSAGTVTIIESSGAAAELLASVSYAPGSNTDTASTGSLAPVDSTNLAITFTVPASGTVLVKLSALAYANAASSGLGWALLNTSNTLIAGTRRYVTGSQAAILCGYVVKVTGLTPGASVTYRWGAITIAGSGGSTSYGNPNTTGTYGPAVMEVWTA